MGVKSVLASIYLQIYFHFFLLYTLFQTILYYKFTLYPQRGSQRERSAKRYGLYIPLSPRPLSSTSSYMPYGGSSCFLRDFPPVSSILCFRRSIEVSPYLSSYFSIISLIKVGSKLKTHVISYNCNCLQLSKTNCKKSTVMQTLLVTLGRYVRY